MLPVRWRIVRQRSNIRDVNDRLSALRHRDFRLLVAGTASSSLGNSITPIALAFAVLDLGGSATDLGLVVGAFALTDVVTVLFGGVLGDRLPRKLMMEGSAAASALTQAFLAAALISGFATIPMLGIVGALNGCLSALSQPSSRAMTRETVPPEQLPSAVSVRSLLQTGAATVGYAVGGVLVAVAGSGWAIGVDALTFAIAAYCYSRLRVPHVVADGPRASMLADLGDGAREVLSHPWLWLLIGQAMLYHLFYGGAQTVLGPIVIGDEFGRSSWGLAMGTLMAGFVVGGLVCLRWRPRRSLLIGTMLLSLTALFPIAMALSGQLWVVLLGAFLHGFGLQVFDVFWDLSIQQNVAPDKLARVYSFDAVGSFVARPLGLALTGPVAVLVGYDRWLLVVGCVMGASSLLALTSSDVRRLVRDPAPKEPVSA
jgi:MFS family permease